MKFYKELVKANIPVLLNASGKIFLIDKLIGGDSVDVTFIVGGSEQPELTDRKMAFKCQAEYDAIILKAQIDTEVWFFVSNDDVSLGVASGSAVTLPEGVKITNTAGEAIPVLFGGVVTPVLGNVEVHNQPLSTITNVAPVTIAAANVAQALISDATQKRLRIRNSHATAAVCIGGAGITMANGAIRLESGDVWLEVDAAGAAWFAVSDTAGAIVQIQAVK